MHEIGKFWILDYPKYTVFMILAPMPTMHPFSSFGLIPSPANLSAMQSLADRWWWQSLCSAAEMVPSLGFTSHLSNHSSYSPSVIVVLKDSQRLIWVVRMEWTFIWCEETYLFCTSMHPFSSFRLMPSPANLSAMQLAFGLRGQLNSAAEMVPSLGFTSHLSNHSSSLPSEIVILKDGQQYTWEVKMEQTYILCEGIYLFWPKTVARKQRAKTIVACMVKGWFSCLLLLPK